MLNPIRLILLLLILSTAFFSCKKDTIRVEPEPRPEFTSDKRTIEPGDSIVFTNQSKGDIETYSWSFEGAENTFSDQRNPPPIKYKKPGRFLVSLTVSGPTGSNTITKTQYVNVTTFALSVEWLKKDSTTASGRVYFRGKIKGYNNSSLYRLIGFIYDKDDSNPGTNSDGYYVYPNSRGEFLIGLTKPGFNFYYRIYAVSLDYEVFLSEVQRTTFPEITVDLTSFTLSGDEIHLIGKVNGLIGSGEIKLITTRYPNEPYNYSNSGGIPITRADGGFDIKVKSAGTILKQNAAVYARDLSTQATAQTKKFTFTLPESFESSDFSYANSWSTNSFQRTTAKSNSGLYSLSSPSFSGYSGGYSQSCSISIRNDTTSNFSFYLAQEGLSGSDRIEFYVDYQLKETISPSSSFVLHTYSLPADYHYIQWKVVKFTANNPDGKIYLDDVKFGD